MRMGLFLDTGLNTLARVRPPGENTQLARLHEMKFFKNCGERKQKGQRHRHARVVLRQGKDPPLTVYLGSAWRK